MIEITIDAAIKIYLAICLSLILTFWIYHHMSNRKRKIIIKDSKLLVCEYCLNPYLGDISKELTTCPKCKSINKSIEF